MTELLLDTELSGRQRRFATMLRRSAEALLSLINDILDLSKIEAERLQLEEIDFDLRDVVEDVMEMLADPGPRERIWSWSTSCRADMTTTVCGDPNRLRQILVNLVGNAIKFTEQGEVAVKVEPIEDRGTSRCCIASRLGTPGIGVPQTRFEERIFDSFAQD